MGSCHRLRLNERSSVNVLQITCMQWPDVAGMTSLSVASPMPRHGDGHGPRPATVSLWTSPLLCPSPPASSPAIPSLIDIISIHNPHSLVPHHLPFALLRPIRACPPRHNKPRQREKRDQSGTRPPRLELHIDRPADTRAVSQLSIAQDACLLDAALCDRRCCHLPRSGAWRSPRAGVRLTRTVLVCRQASKQWS